MIQINYILNGGRTFLKSETWAKTPLKLSFDVFPAGICRRINSKFCVMIQIFTDESLEVKGRMIPAI